MHLPGKTGRGWSLLPLPVWLSLFLVFILLVANPSFLFGRGDQEVVEDERAAGEGNGEKEEIQGEDVSSDQEQSVSILVSGPDAGSGLPFLPPNAIPFYRGLYETPSQYVYVYYTRREIVSQSSWEEVECGGNRLMTFRGEVQSFRRISDEGGEDVVLATENPLAVFYGREGFSLFFFQQEHTLACDFIEKFIRKFLFFSLNTGRGAPSVQEGGASQRESPPPQFPAVLEE